LYIIVSQAHIDYLDLWQKEAVVALLLVLLFTLAMVFSARMIYKQRVLEIREIAERNEAADALKESQQNLAITLNSIGDAVIATDTTGCITGMNPTAERLTGWILADALGQPLTDVFRIISAQTRLPSLNPVQLVMERGEVVGLANHTALLARDGREYQITDSAAPIRNAADQIVGVVLVFSDVTEKYRADAALHDSEETFRTLATVAPIGIYVTDPTGNCLYANSRWCEMAGMTSQEALGQGWINGLHPQDRAEVFAKWRQMVESQGTWGMQYRFITPDARVTWVYALATPQRDSAGEIIRYLGVNLDITERKLAEEALRAAKDHLQTTLNAIPDLLFEVDASGRVLSYHAHRSDLLAAPPEVFMGKCFADFLPPAATDVCMSAIREAATKGWATGTVYSLPLPQGETWFELSVAAIPIVAGETPRFIVLTRDVTERKVAELALQAALREKTALLLEVHHRVKNNLQVIASLLRLESFRSTDAPTKSVLQDMHGRVRSMALLHETIYRKGTFAAIDLGIYVGKIASESLKSMQVNLGAVHLQLDMETLQVGLDQATPAGMLISELVSNSLKHAFPAGRAGAIDIALHPLDTPGQWRLRVSDTGIGLAPDFEEQRKASLGLQLAGDMATQMGGALHIGAGPQAVFTVDFKAEVPAPLKITLGGVKP
jgi:PAS domain S-box-containing protein